jgi:hypothetical protein
VHDGQAVILHDPLGQAAPFPNLGPVGFCELKTIHDHEIIYG